MAIKTCFVIVEDCTNLFITSLNIHILYKEEKTVILLAFSNRTSLNLSILELNNYIYNEFVLTIVKNKITYTATAGIKTTSYNHKLAYDMIVMMMDHKFLSIRYQIDILAYLS